MDDFPEYHKIQTIFKRDMSSPRKTLIPGDWSKLEFEFLQANQWVFTEKVDGTNIRILVRGDTVRIGGRTSAAMIPATLAGVIDSHFRERSTRGALLESFPPDTHVVLYGEGYGPKIQKGGHYREDQAFVLFDVKVGDWWLRRADVESVGHALGLDVVPVIGKGTLHDAVTLCRNDLQSRWGNFRAEGIVARPEVELKTRGGERIIAKIKCRDFTGLES
jgi:hypothetical protein